MHYPATYHGLHAWTQAMFEHLGWMILAKRDGNSIKIKEYKECIAHLKLSLEEKVAETKDDDKKADLLILHKNVLVLMAHVNKDMRSNKK